MAVYLRRGGKLCLPGALLLGVFAGALCAQSIPDRPSGYVHDTVGLLSQEARLRLEQALGEFEKATSNQLVVAVFESLEGGSLEDFSIRLAQQWKIGTRQNDNGIILLIIKSDRQARIEVGYGLEGALPDAVASQIIRSELVPNFRNGDYDRGVEQSVRAIIEATRGEYKAKNDTREDKFRAYAPLAYAGLILYLIFPLICYAGILFVSVGILGFPLGLFVGLAAVLFLMALRQLLGWQYLGRTYSSGGGGSGGGFSGGGFGGFSGGGGGSFGGGGASGRW